MLSFPWKKVKKTSISQLVKDHVNCQSGSPLMVETGFPTSLVDLVVKNRSRFKKPSKKNKPPSPAMFPPSPSPSPPPPPSPVNLPSNSEYIIDDKGEKPDSPLICEGEKPDSCKNLKMNKTEEGWCNGGVSMNQGLVVVFKMFLVAVLVLGMNNLVVGITMSAFLLFFLEYLGGFFSGVQRRVRLMIQGIWEMFRAKAVESEEEDYVFKAPSQHQELSKDGCFDEIEVVQETYVEDSQCVRENIEECICDGKLKCVGVDVERVVMEKGEEFRCESKEKKSHRAKIKSKMKKLVPKKFRKKKGSALESHMMLLDEIDYIIEGSKEIEGSSEGNMKSDVGIVSSVGIDDKSNIVEVVGGAGESSKGLTDVSVEESFNGIDKATIVGEDGLSEIEHNSMYIALFLAVLVGLIGGRILALVFTLTCCLMLKRGEGIGRFTKLPVIRSFAKKFC
ncbi:uncharacterized protein LOC132043313 [Lycium ferocissimum]|uniref:uncharacterized protein LOC132043313 n=1 Tax=Lycium ferocissimum TaxID=112874 RepID=UPI002815F2AB|nr:uncharacterized protein LOC132043313 [Lycium ferocissimum]